MTPMDHSGDPALPAPRGEDPSTDSQPAAAPDDAPDAEMRATREDAPAGDVEALLPLFARREEEKQPEPPPGRMAALLNYGVSAGFVLAVLGLAFAAGTYLFGAAPVQDQTAAHIAARENADMQRKSQAATAALTAEVGALKANVDTLRASLAQTLKEQSAKDQKSLEKSVDGLKAKVDSVKSDTAASLAELAGKVEKLQRDPALKQVAERLERIEKQTALPTGSIAPMVKAATADHKGAAPKSQPAEAARRPQLITSWVVREVYDGVALVENAHGAIEVAPGDRIPGAGTVRSIERRGGGWIVVTTQGIVDYDRSLTP